MEGGSGGRRNGKRRQDGGRETGRACRAGRVLQQPSSHRTQHQNVFVGAMRDRSLVALVLVLVAAVLVLQVCYIGSMMLSERCSPNAAAVCAALDWTVVGRQQPCRRPWRCWFRF